MFENKEHKIIFDNKWMQVKETFRGFIYSQRKNKNSIALLLYNNQNEILVRFQPMCAVEELGQEENRIAPCCITGSVDKDKSYLEIAIEEAQEEAGYDVRNCIKYVGNYIVSTQTNEICYCYIADVTGLKQTQIKGDGSFFESISYNKWVNIKDVKKLDNLYGGLLILLDKLEDYKVSIRNNGINEVLKDLENFDFEIK